MALTFKVELTQAEARAVVWALRKINADELDAFAEGGCCPTPADVRKATLRFEASERAEMKFNTALGPYGD